LRDNQVEAQEGGDGDYRTLKAQGRNTGPSEAHLRDAQTKWLVQYVNSMCRVNN